MVLKINNLDTVYEAVSSNRNENNISTRGNYLLYSRCRCPIIYNLAQKQVQFTLTGHDDEIASQSWIENLGNNQSSAQLNIISTSHDKLAIIWQVDHHENSTNYKALYQFSSPDDDVFMTATCILASDGNYYSVTTTIVGNIYCWRNADLVQTIEAKYCCLASKLFTIEEQTNLTFLFISGSDNKVHVFQFSTPIEAQPLEHLFDLTGYNDWVKCIDSVKLSGRPNEFLIATASQDSLIRVWHLRLLIDQDATKIRTIVSKQLKTTSTDKKVLHLTATLETVLSGHDGFVHGLCWFKKQQDSRLQLLSCSADKTIVLWCSSIAPLSKKNDLLEAHKYEQCPASQGVWSEFQRVGETGETNLPFIGICLSDTDERVFYAQSLRGAIHSWRLELDNEKEKNEMSSNKWVASESITGHHEPITDLSWEKSGSYLLSCSLDKTARLHGLSKIDNKWHELTRPQVHGHEINCIASLNFIKFASGAEEKTIRTFGATQFFLKNYRQIAATTDEDLDRLINLDNGDNQQQLPAHAQLPALGLSNRGASSPYDIGNGCNGANGEGDQDTSAKSNALPASQDGAWNEISDLVKRLAEIEHLTEPPYEEILLQSTLWWETNKLFGHCNELHALACDSTGSFLASASKANRLDLANILVWECEKFRKVATIEHHSLTITRVKFSPDDKYLLSVSRDRTWSLSQRTGSLRNAYKFLCGTHKSNAIHERIIWDCCWTHDSRHFMTVSRDKKAILWNAEKILTFSNNEPTNDESSQKIQSSSSDMTSCVMASKLFDCAIQAVDSLPPSRVQESTGGVGDKQSTCDWYLFALAFEDGSMQLQSISTSSVQGQWVWTCLRSFANHHQLSIRRLAFRPTSSRSKRQCDDEDVHWLASGSDDAVLKVIKFNIYDE